MLAVVNSDGMMYIPLLSLRLRLRKKWLHQCALSADALPAAVSADCGGK